MMFRWRADDDPLIEVFGSSLPISKNKNKIKLVKVGPPLTKLSGSAHASFLRSKIYGKKEKTKYNKNAKQIVYLDLLYAWCVIMAMFGLSLGQCPLRRGQTLDSTLYNSKIQVEGLNTM